ncbi:Uncharacterised protein [uncultured archaeon]|nr:Uncharacterised protein [uncultured archaeon]
MRYKPNPKVRRSLERSRSELMSLHSLFGKPSVHPALRRSSGSGVRRPSAVHVSRIARSADPEEKAKTRMMKLTSKRESKPMPKPQFARRRMGMRL